MLQTHRPYLLPSRSRNRKGIVSTRRVNYLPTLRTPVRFWTESPKNNALGSSDYAQLPSELQREVYTLVEQAKQRSGWLVRQTLRTLEIAPATYYRWCRATA